MSKKRDREYGPKPQDVPLRREDLPQHPARLRSGYCKKRKAEHLYELDHTDTYRHRSHSQGIGGPCYITGWTDWKWYRCTGCGKKRYEVERHELDEPRIEQKEYDNG